jgi:hypothetical protein
MAGFQTAAVGNITVQRGRPPMPVVNIDLVRSRPVEKAAPVKQGRGVRISPEAVAAIRAQRSLGRSLHEIAQEFGVAHMSVHRHTKDIPEPECGWKTGKHESRLPQAKIQRMRRAGFTFAEIAEDVGASQSAVYYQLNDRPRDHRRGRSGKTSRLLQHVFRTTGIPQSVLRHPKTAGRSRLSDDVSRARHIVFWMLVRRKGFSFPKAGRALGGFDHTTILNGCKRVDALIAHLGLELPQDSREAVARLWSADWPARKAA